MMKLIYVSRCHGSVLASKYEDLIYSTTTTHQPLQDQNKVLARSPCSEEQAEQME